MGKQIERLDAMMRGVLRVVWYRSLHMVSVPVSPQEFLAYAQEHESEGELQGAVKEIRDGPLFGLWQWNDIAIGKGLAMNIWFFGARRGAQTVIVREKFYRFNFNSRSIRLLADPLGLVWNGNGAAGPSTTSLHQVLAAKADARVSMALKEKPDQKI